MSDLVVLGSIASQITILYLLFMPKDRVTPTFRFVVGTLSGIALVMYAIELVHNHS